MESGGIWNEILLNYIVPAAAALLIAAISYAVKQFGVWLKSKIPTNATKTHQLIEMLIQHSTLTVEALIQTEVEALKEKAADGKLSDADKQYLRDKARQKIKASSAQVLDELKQYIPDVDVLVNDCIEYVIRRLKKN